MPFSTHRSACSMSNDYCLPQLTNIQQLTSSWFFFIISDDPLINRNDISSKLQTSVSDNFNKIAYLLIFFELQASREFCRLKILSFLNRLSFWYLVLSARHLIRQNNFDGMIYRKNESKLSFSITALCTLYIDWVYNLNFHQIRNDKQNVIKIEISIVCQLTDLYDIDLIAERTAASEIFVIHHH